MRKDAAVPHSCTSGRRALVHNAMLHGTRIIAPLITQQVQLDAEHGGRSGSAAYLSCGEGTFPIRRLSQVAMCYENKTGIPNQHFLSNVHIEHCYNTDDAQSILVSCVMNVAYISLFVVS